MRLIIIFLFLFAVNTVFAATSLTPTEKRLTAIATSYQASQLTLLLKLVNINSGTSNINGVKKVGEIVKNQFKQLGFKTYWVAEPKALKRAPTLIAEHQGIGKRLLLIGHLDTVFQQNSPFQKMRIDNTVAKGPGVADDKGGILIILYALKALQAMHILDKLSITVVLTGDEENSGKPVSVSRRPLFLAAQKADIALDFEPATEPNLATIARRGISNWTLEVLGKEAHSASIFQKDTGAGAIYELARILNAMREYLHRQDEMTFNPGVLIAGNIISFDKTQSEGKAFGKDNVVAKTVFARGDFRFSTLQQKQLIRETLEKIMAQHLPNTQAKLTIEDAIPPMLLTVNNEALLAEYSEASVDLGYGSVHGAPASARGAADISHIAGIVPANLGGLGVVGGNYHTEQENMLINSLPMQTARVALLIYRLTLS